MRYFIVVYFCLISVFCLGQKKVIIKFPKRGKYEIILKAHRNDTVSFQRESFAIPTDTLKIINPLSLQGNIVNNMSLMSMVFESNVMFGDTKFKNHFQFFALVFNKNVGFYGTIFQSNAVFNTLIFKDEVNFNSSNFQKEINFTNCIFDHLVRFNGLTGFGGLSFSHSQIPNILDYTIVKNFKADFRGVLIDSIQSRKPKIPKYMSKGDSVLRVTLFNQSLELNKCIIQLKDSNLENIILPYDRFWADTTGHSYEEKTTLYEKLIKKCKEEGMDESVIGWSTELKKIENLHNFPKIGSFLNWFQGIFWNYGFTKSLILLWILGVFLLFNIINFFIYPQLINVYFNPKLGLKLIAKPLVQDEQAVIGILRKNRYTRLRYMLHYTGMIFFGIKLEHTDMSFKHLGWVALLYFEFVIGIVLLGFALNFVVSK